MNHDEYIPHYIAGWREKLKRERRQRLANIAVCAAYALFILALCVLGWSTWAL